MRVFFSLLCFSGFWLVGCGGDKYGGGGECWDGMG